MSLTNFKAAFERHSNAIYNYINQRTVPLVSETITIPAGDTRTYSLSTLLGNISGFDVLSTLVDVKVKDTDTLSETHDHFINGEAVITVGISPTGNIKLVNYSNSSLECHVRIDPPPVVS